MRAPFELTDVADDFARDELDDVRPDRGGLVLRLRAQDGDPGLQVRGGEIGDQPPLEATPQALLEGHDLLWGPVARQDDLLAVLVDRVERVEELLLRALLVRDELDIVDQKDVDLAVAAAELVDPALLDAGDELVGELLAGRVGHLLAREPRDHLVPDGVHQVGLAESHAAVQEERVVCVTRALGHREARRVRQAVGRADDEVPERVAWVKVGGAALAADPGRAPRDRLGGDRLRGVGRLRGHLEIDLDAVAHDACEGLADQRAVPRLEPVLREPVGNGDAKPVFVDGHEGGVAEPGLVIGGGQRNLELPEGGAPHLLRVHSVRSTPSKRFVVALSRRWVGDHGLGPAMAEAACVPRGWAPAGLSWTLPLRPGPGARQA